MAPSVGDRGLAGMAVGLNGAADGGNEVCPVARAPSSPCSKGVSHFELVYGKKGHGPVGLSAIRVEVLTVTQAYVSN